MLSNIFRKLRSDEAGPSTMEYAVLFVIIVVGGLSIWTTLGSKLEKQVKAGQSKFETTLSEKSKK